MTLRESADKSAQLKEFFLFSYVLHLDRWSGCAWVEWTILWLFEVLQRHQVMFWFIFSTNAVVTHITYRLSNSDHIYQILEINYRSWIGSVSLVMKGAHDRTLQNSSCKNVLMFMVWEHAQTLMPIRKISCRNYVIETDLSDL